MSISVVVWSNVWSKAPSLMFSECLAHHSFAPSDLSFLLGLFPVLVLFLSLEELGVYRETALVAGGGNAVQVNLLLLWSL